MPSSFVSASRAKIRTGPVPPAATNRSPTAICEIEPRPCHIAASGFHAPSSAISQSLSAPVVGGIGPLRLNALSLAPPTISVPSALAATAPSPS